MTARFKTTQDFTYAYLHMWKHRCHSAKKPDMLDNCARQFFASFDEHGNLDCDLFKKKVTKAFPPITNNVKLLSGRRAYDTVYHTTCKMAEMFSNYLRGVRAPDPDFKSLSEFRKTLWEKDPRFVDFLDTLEVVEIRKYAAFLYSCSDCYS